MELVWQNLEVEARGFCFEQTKVDYRSSGLSLVNSNGLSDCLQSRNACCVMAVASSRSPPAAEVGSGQ